VSAEGPFVPEITEEIENRVDWVLALTNCEEIDMGSPRFRAAERALRRRLGHNLRPFRMGALDYDQQHLVSALDIVFEFVWIVDGEQVFYETWPDRHAIECGCYKADCRTKEITNNGGSP
jgi:hypothetical protein